MLWLFQVEGTAGRRAASSTPPCLPGVAHLALEGADPVMHADGLLFGSGMNPTILGHAGEPA